MDHTIWLKDMDGNGYKAFFSGILMDIDLLIFFFVGYGWIWILQTSSMSISNGQHDGREVNEVKRNKVVPVKMPAECSL